MAQVLAGLFPDEASARAAYGDLCWEGFGAEAVMLLTVAAVAPTVGGWLDAPWTVGEAMLLGTIVGPIVGLMMVLVPGLFPARAAHPLPAGFAGLLLGEAVGALTGALAGALLTRWRARPSASAAGPPPRSAVVIVWGDAAATTAAGAVLAHHAAQLLRPLESE